MNYKSKSLWLFVSYLLLLICNSFLSFSIIPYKDIWKYEKLIHFSAIGADKNSKSEYAKTKFFGEEEVKKFRNYCKLGRNKKIWTIRD